MKDFFNCLTGRLILGGLLTHLILLPVTVLGILYILEGGIKDLFLDHTRLSARLLADIIQTKDPEAEEELIIQIIDSALLAGQVNYAVLNVQGRYIQSELSHNVSAPTPFIDDFDVGQQGDTDYFMSLPLIMGSQRIPAVLRLGFDEHVALETIELSRERLIYLIGGYIVLTLVLLIYLSKRLTDPIDKLRRSSRAIASGRFEDRLNVTSKITDVQALINDLEEMRSRLVNQTLTMREANRLLSEQQERLVESETMAAVGEMASIMAHNVRNPLASIRSSAELALESELPDDLRLLTENMINDVDRVDQWIRELLRTSTPGEHKFKTVVSVIDQLNECLEAFEHDFKRSGIETCLSVSKPPPRIFCEEQLLRQTFNSLIANSVDAMPKGGLLSVNIGEPDANGVEIQISDTGCGIRKDQLKKVFKPFFTSKKEGVGLGLFMVKRIVESHGGSISASSQFGKGTTFTVKFPGVRAKNPSVLLIDDELRFATNVTAYMVQHGYEIETAFNGLNGLELFKTFKPEVVVLDVNLPDSNGFELLARLKQMDEKIKVIMITGKGYLQAMGDGGFEDMRAIAQNAGADNFVVKPVSLKKLRQLIDETAVSCATARISKPAD